MVDAFASKIHEEKLLYDYFLRGAKRAEHNNLQALADRGMKRNKILISRDYIEIGGRQMMSRS